MGFDGVEEGGFVKPIAGHDVSFCLHQQADSVQIAKTGGKDKRGAFVAVEGFNSGMVGEQTGDALAVVGIQRGRGGTKQFQEGRQTVGAVAVYVGTLGDGLAEQRQVSLPDRLDKLLINGRSRMGCRCGFGAPGG